MPRSLARLGAAFLLACLALGCDRMRDVRRCRGLAQDVNASFDVIEREAAGGKSSAAYGRIAKEYGALAKSLDRFDGGTPELGRTVGEFGALARNAARQATALDQALDAGTEGTAQLARHELERLARHEKSLVGRIDDECRPK